MPEHNVMTEPISLRSRWLRKQVPIDVEVIRVTFRDRTRPSQALCCTACASAGKWLPLYRPSLRRMKQEMAASPLARRVMLPGSGTTDVYPNCTIGPKRPTVSEESTCATLPPGKRKPSASSEPPPLQPLNWASISRVPLVGSYKNGVVRLKTISKAHGPGVVHPGLLKNV